MDASGGFGLGLLVAGFWFGFRHGIDFDHIAAITDITASQEERRRALLFGTLYALGHALVVLVLGVLAIAAGDRLPAGVDDAMTRVVGATLLLLGGYVVFSLIRHGRDFRLRSRWMLVFSGIRRGASWARDRARSRRVPAPVGGQPGGGEQRDQGSDAPRLGSRVEGSASEPFLWHHGHHGRPGHHHHQRPHRDDPSLTYGRATAFGVGMIHGVGAETPTQVLIFLAAAGAGGVGAGILTLMAFIAGLLASNSLITLGSAFGFLRASSNFAVYAAVAVLTAGFSLVLGTIFVLNRADVLPPLFG
jgi:ABC-type nickel/cobalt efflux system permease component RcnA